MKNKNVLKISFIALFAAIICAASTVILSTAAYADTVITAPIDSRPISNEYLSDLAALGGDDVIGVDKKHLDFFTAYLSDSRFGNSKAVRSEIYDSVAENNKKNTVVIINSSSYVTNGLVGSRVGKNYDSCMQAMDEFEQLMTDFTEPDYYFNLSIPRSLPETRFNTIWREKNCPVLYGLGHFYLECMPDAEDKKEIQAKYDVVTPSQILLEYGYVENKAAELGERELTEWEKKFLRYFHTDFAYKEPYKTYVENYKKPYTACAEMFARLLVMQKKGLLDEIIVSNDDLQLPDSIKYFYGKKAKWIQTEKGSPIKFSFARTMRSVAYNSIYKQFDAAYGSRERAYALVGRGKKVNFINGVDEVTQLIYARSLSKRKKLTADLNIITNQSDKTAGSFDVTSIQNLLDTAGNFVSANHNKTQKKFDLYLYNYNMPTEHKSFLQKMKKDYSKGDNIGLIEIFKIGTGNRVLKDILNDTSKAYPSVTELSSYSAWNTNGNAIGLGIAHSQVYAITEQINHNPTVYINKQLKVLAQHIYEDGIYTARVKLALSNQGYKPYAVEEEKSDTLYPLLNDGSVNLVGRTVKAGGKEYIIKKSEMKSYGFPWRRIFDIYLDIDITTKQVRAEN